jgi:hypothetical protein
MNYRAGERNGPVEARELYDYETDPMETANLIDVPEYAPVVARFEELAKGGWQGCRLTSGG